MWVTLVAVPKEGPGSNCTPEGVTLVGPEVQKPTLALVRADRDTVGAVAVWSDPITWPKAASYKEVRKDGGPG